MMVEQEMKGKTRSTFHADSRELGQQSYIHGRMKTWDWSPSSLEESDSGRQMAISQMYHLSDGLGFSEQMCEGSVVVLIQIICYSIIHV
jgi:hypothetical protein